MTYTLPGVSVTQILLRSSQNLANSSMLPCFVGSINQVVTNSPINLTFPITSATIVYPGLALSAIIETSSIAITINNAYVQIGTSAVTGSALVASGNIIQGTTGSFLNAVAGDSIIFNTLTHGSYTIKSINGDVATINEIISYPAAIADAFIIQRSVGNVTAIIGGASYASSSFTFTSLEYGTYNIIAGTPYISYIALRKDLTGFYDVTNLDDLKVDMDVTISNPLGFYLGTVAPTANGGSETLAYILTDETDTSYITALSDLSTRQDIYLLVPLSNSTNVAEAYAAHVTTMSEPASSYFRATLLNATLPVSSILVSETYTHS